LARTIEPICFCRLHTFLSASASVAAITTGLADDNKAADRIERIILGNFPVFAMLRL
jgi:hypothetical protein